MTAKNNDRTAGSSGQGDHQTNATTPFTGTIGFADLEAWIEKTPIDGSVAEKRKGFAARMLSDYGKGAEYVTLGTTRARRFAPAEPTLDTAIVYFHGGGYVFGSPDTHHRLCSRLAELTGLETYAVNYRLAPEHVWPAPLEDALEAVSELRKRGFTNIVLAGDSAGGHLSLNTALKLGATDHPALAVIAFSPNTDRSGLSETRTINTPRDPMVDDAADLELAKMIAGEPFDPNNPEVSPVLGNLKLLPPTHVEVGDREVLLGDSLVLHQRAIEAGAQISLSVTSGAFHMWQEWTPWLPEAEESLQRSAGFLRGLL